MDCMALVLDFREEKGEETMDGIYLKCVFVQRRVDIKGNWALLEVCRYKRALSSSREM